MEYRCVSTVCPYCGVGCNLLLHVLEGKIIETWPSKDGPTNQGKLCIKGWSAHEFVQHPDRLKAPLVRKHGTLTETDWDSAMDPTSKTPEYKVCAVRLETIE